MNKSWTDTEKYDARFHTVIDAYRRLSGNPSVPPDREYWTMCGLNVESGTEFDQVVSSHLISPNQFHGVELNKTTARRNLKAHPDEGNWYQGYFDLHMENAWFENRFSPAIVNLDTTKTPARAWDELKKVMLMLHAHPLEDIMLVANFVVDGRVGEQEFPDIELYDGWKLVEGHYSYPGQPASFTMGTIILWKGK